MVQFKRGDKVRRVNGDTFTNGQRIATVLKVDFVGVWFRETGTWLASSEVELAEPAPDNPHAFKADAGKPRWSLLTQGCPNALAGVVRVLTFAVKPVADGGKGYLPHSWKQVPNAKERYEDALHRHLNKIALGETHDDESGELHWHHVATNALFLAELNKDTK